MVDENFIDSAAPTNAASPPPTTASSDTVAASPPAEPTLDLAVMQQELSELKDTLAQYIRQSTPDIEQVRLALQSAEAERDNATGELKKLQRKNTLTALAEKNAITNSKVSWPGFYTNLYFKTPLNIRQTKHFVVSNQTFVAI